MSFSGIVTFPQSGRLQDIAKRWPADDLLIESDAPYLAPVPVRGKRPNEPAYLAHTARYLAELREQVYEDFAVQTARNAKRLFGL